MSIDSQINLLLRAYKQLQKMSSTPDYYQQLSIFKREIADAYYKDPKFLEMSKESMRILLALNLKFRVIALHAFGLNIEL